MLEENLRQWIEQARKEGFEEGQVLGLQDVLLAQMTFRFGRLPVDVRRQVKEISSAQELLKLGRRVVRAKTLEDMGLG